MEKLEIAKVLEELGKGELQRFKDKLSEIKLEKGYKHVSQRTLQEADASSLTELLISLYGTDYGAEVAAEVLRAIHQGALADRIAGEHFTAQQQRLDPWVMSSDFLPLLLPGTQNKPHQMITFERTDLEKMQMLYELMLSWRRRYKRRFYSALKATNPALLEELEGGHFVERHREELIKRASLVDEVLALLYGDILDNEQYLEICTEPGKMRKLYKLVPNWDDERKDRLYQALKETNRVLVKQLEASTSPREHFVERHREQLIQRVSSLDTVLSLLREDMLNAEDLWSIWAEGSDPERMRKLYELVPGWNTLRKDRLYWVLTVTNPALIEELEAPFGPAEHFVMRHGEKLIRRVSLVDRVLHLLHGDVLNDEQCHNILVEGSNLERMRKLYELVPGWDTLRKDQLYRTLAITNPALIEELEGEHFVERHRVLLIWRVSRVDEVLTRLGRDVLDDEQSRSIQTDPVRMRKLYELVSSWETGHKERLYQVLKVTDRALVEELEGAGGSEQKPSASASAGTTGEHFVERHQEQLIQRVSSVDQVLDLLRRDVLTPEKYRSIRIYPETMRKLYDLVQPWDRGLKDRLYQALKETNRALVEELEGEHFVDRHREQLIQRVSNVNQVLHWVLPHGSIRTEDTDSEKMRKLFELVPCWDRRKKDSLHKFLKETNRALIEELEGEHFVDQHREQLIQRVSKVDILCRRALGKEQSRSVVTDPVKMRKLYELVPHWDTGHKDQLHQALRATNRALVNELEEGHFVERHREQLIQQVSRVDEVLALLHGALLDPQQHGSIAAEKTDPERMRKLYELVPSWDKLDKDCFYRVLRATNRALVKELEEGHFVERHPEQLIQRVSRVDKVLALLPDTVLDPQQHGSIAAEKADPEKMRQLYELVPSWNELDKDRFYWVLRATNRALVKQLEEITSKDSDSDPSSAAKTEAAGVISCKQTLLPSTGSAAGGAAAGETSPSEDPSGDPWGQDKCNLCPQEEDPPEEIHPEIVWGPNWNQKTYRIHLPRAGSFRCCETELGVEVRAAVTIQYGYDSWDRRLSAAEKQQWMVAGPLFDIWVEPAGAVTAIHLPHFLCLAGTVVDVSHLQVARFVDCGMTLESPTRVRPFHAVLANPSFSPIGVLWKQIYSKLFPPVHTLVLLYRSSQAADITLHLYLIPRDLSIAQAIEDNEMKYQSKRLRKPSKSKPLYFGSCAFVSSPSSIEVTPKELEFCNMAAHCLDPDMEIYTRDLGDKLELSLVEKNEQQRIWETIVRPGDVMISASTPTQADIQDNMSKSLRVALQGTLDELGISDTKKFKSRLNHMELPKRYKRIPNGKLETADSLTVCELLVQYYTMGGAVEVAIQALKEISRNDLAITLEKDTRKLPHHIDSMCSLVSAMDLGSPL